MTTKRWLVAIVLVAGVLRFYPLWFGLPYAHARPDETTALGIAVQIRGGDPNPHFFHWGSVTLYVFAATHAIVAAVRQLVGLDPALGFRELVLSARAVIALAGTLTVAVVFALGRRVGGTATGLLAALFLAVAILHVRESHFAMTDVLMTLLATTSLTLLLGATARALGGGAATGWFALAGFAGGLGASTKYSAGAIVAAMFASQALLLARGRVPVGSFHAWAPAAAFLLAVGIGFVAGTPYAMLDFQRFADDVRFDITHLSAGHGIDVGRGWTYHLLRSLPYGLGVVTFGAALAGIPFTARRNPRLAFVLAAFAAAFYISIGSGKTAFFRYVLPLLPIFCVTAAVAVEDLARLVARRTTLGVSAATLGLGLVVAGPGLVNSIWFDVLLARTDTRVLAGQWLKTRAHGGDTVFDIGGEYAELDLTPAAVHHWQHDATTGSFVNAGDRVPDWLVLHKSPVLAHVPVPGSLLELARARYDLALEVVGSRPEAKQAVYDRQDAFFMPLTGFSSIERPGPTIRVYYRRADPPAPPPAIIRQP